MKRISFSFISAIFTLFALAISIHSLFFSTETATRTQAIYWFCIALVAAITPHLKDLAPYIRRVKVGEVEVELNELKKEVQTVKNEIRELDGLMTRLASVSQNEASIPTEIREFRQEVFNRYAERLAKKTADDRLAEQESYTQEHLRKASMSIPELKVALKQLNYYHGTMDPSFSLELAQAIEKFQSENVQGNPDGIAGPITLSKIDELLRSQSR